MNSKGGSYFNELSQTFFKSYIKRTILPWHTQLNNWNSQQKCLVMFSTNLSEASGLKTRGGITPPHSPRQQPTCQNIGPVRVKSDWRQPGSSCQHVHCSTTKYRGSPSYAHFGTWKKPCYMKLVSGTVLWSPTNANSATYRYISQKTW